MSRPRQICVAAALALALGVVGPPALAGDDPNACDHPSKSPDVIVGDIDQVIYWGEIDDTSAFSFSTWSCNVGTCGLSWIAETNQHPVIAQNMFRLKSGRFEQIGQSWLKHGFFALSLELCSQGCEATTGTVLGVNCADPYTADLNGFQQTLGPKWQINPSTGEFPYPFADSDGEVNEIFKRLQVKTTDIRSDLNAGARYYFEGQYVTQDDAAAGNGNNNASYREIAIDDSFGVETAFVGNTFRGRPAIFAWNTADSGVRLRGVNSGDGVYYVASRVRSLPEGRWSYEYAVQNLNSHRAAKAFRVPLPGGITITDIGFHDVDYHSGEPFDGTDWSAALESDGRELVWRTSDFGDDPFANALRWGTLYNFRFTADVPPDTREQLVTLEMFRLGQPGEISVQQTVPLSCHEDGVCDGLEDCVNCPADCLAPGETCCGDAVCAGGEDGCTCTEDCGVCLAGGEVPDGSGVAKPLTLTRSESGMLELDWEVSCSAEDSDYAVYRGLLGNFTSHQRLLCSTGGATSTSIAVPFFNAYFLVAPTNGITEGSFGADSGGKLRPPGPAQQSCLPRHVTSCEDVP